MTVYDYIEANGLTLEDRGFGYPDTHKKVLWEIPEVQASVSFSEPEPGTVIPHFHLDVAETWSVWLFRKCKREWASWLPTWQFWPLMTAADEDSDALNRLREHFGFQYLGDCPSSDGKTRRIYIHYGP